ncbi:hypothetical protein [Methanoregula formicica]|uniref:Uncharacterized protein n=1 Tax=Methanoregula formicica (strain DSM 22288 / NBRC 105244 / SMSP) TaxID=593750 RepID=L0HF37_METFS|nr:hypothetical protein [Methanoregula formicica]AGB02406.1 hypothetical protein Metfor_1367 [Methanoregula formicica SMSP]
MIAAGCPNVPDCELCPEFEPCTRAFLEDVARGQTNIIFAGEITFDPMDLPEYRDLLGGSPLLAEA